MLPDPRASGPRSPATLRRSRDPPPRRRGLSLPRARRRRPLTAGADAFERGISLGVMSKSFAMAGLRIGWLATRDRELLDRCARMKDYTTICSSAPSEILALIGLRARDRVLARSRADRRRQPRDPRRPVPASRRPRRVGPPARRFDRVPAIARRRADRRFAARLVEAEGVLLLPGSQFGHPGNHFRIGFGRENLPAAWNGSRRSSTASDRPRPTSNHARCACAPLSAGRGGHGAGADRTGSPKIGLHSFTGRAVSVRQIGAAPRPVHVASRGREGFRASRCARASACVLYRARRHRPAGRDDARRVREHRAASPGGTGRPVGPIRPVLRQHQ